MPLTEKEIKNAKPKEKPYKLPDGEGLYLQCSLSAQSSGG